MSSNLHFPGAASRPRSSRSRRKAFAALSMMLWVLLWGGYNTGIELVLSPDFPATRMELVHGVRAFFPLLAAWIGLLIIFAKRGVRVQAVAGPLGLLGFFAAVGLVSSGLLSRAALPAFYWAAMYEAVVVVLVAICSDADALSTLTSVMTLNWVIAIVIMLGLLGAIPSFGGAALVPTEGSPVGVMAYNGGVAAHGTILGMASTRNTGFARYAGVAGLAALARVWQGKLSSRIVWFGALAASLGVLVLAQARTETIGFAVGAIVILWLRKQRRILLMGAGLFALLLLGMLGVLSDIWNFGTRDRGFDPTLTGRSRTWAEGLEVIRHSPWVGFGFQADRYYLNGQHMHDAFFHALIETGVLGTLAYVAAYALAWFLLVRLYLGPRRYSLPEEIPGILVFFTIMSVTESIAYYSANWLLLAPVLAYLQVASWHQLRGRKSAAIELARSGPPGAVANRGQRWGPALSPRG